MPVSDNGAQKRCALCGRRGTQRFHKEGRRWIDDDVVACLKRRGEPVPQSEIRAKQRLQNQRAKAKAKRRARSTV